MGKHISVPQEKIADFCRRHRIQRLSLFGSVLGEDFSAESDVDVLVEFQAGAKRGLLRLAAMEEELTEMLGREVDLQTPGFLSEHFRDKVLAEAELQYAE